MRSGIRFSTPLAILVGLLMGTAIFAILALLKPAALPFQQVVAENLQESPYASAMKVQEAFRLISAEVMPSVVEVTVHTKEAVEPPGDRPHPWNEFFQDPSKPENAPKYYQSQGLGAGVIIERDQNTYYVITNAHVVGTSDEITITLHDESTMKAVLVGKDERKDLALLSFSHETDDLPVIRLGDSDRLYVGDWVLAFGSPYGYKQSVSSGIVSALGRRDAPHENINDFIQTDASINQGNSGGPLVNIQGQMVGVNTFITTPNSGSIGLGFAIPVNNIRNSFRQLIDVGEVHYAWLGASLGSYGIESAESLGYQVGEGVFVYQVFVGSPADMAGIRPGDLIITLDGEPAGDENRLIYRIGDKTPGEQAVFGISRLGEPITLNVLMGIRDDEEVIRTMHERAYPGFVAAPLIPELRTSMDIPEDITGVLVAEVYPRTIAQSIDLRPGDLITTIDGKSITNLAAMYRALEDIRNRPVSWLIYRGGEPVSIHQTTGVSQ